MQNIERRTTWAFAGAHYTTELQAIDANLKAIGGRVLKEFSQEPAAGFVKYGDELAALLMRRAELNAMDRASTESREGTRPEEPEGTREIEHSPADAGMVHP